MKRFIKAVAAALVSALMVAMLAACGSSTTTATSTASQTASTASESGVEVNVASLKGPTSIGLVNFMEAADNGETDNTYNFTIATSAQDEIVPQIISGDIDIALVPANVASVLYNKTNGGVEVIDINTLGVLSIVTGDSSITSFDDLAGKTVYLTGKGQTPEYVMNYLLEQKGMTDEVTLEYKSESTEVVSELVNDPNAVGVLPEPYATAACTQNDSLNSVVNLTDVWDEATADSGSQLVTGVTIVRTEFAEQHPDVVAEFLDDQTDSAKQAVDDPATTAQLVADRGIIDNATVVEKAIPDCNIVCITGDDMKSALSGYLDVLYSADPSSVGGALPGDDFYATDVA